MGAKVGIILPHTQEEFGIVSKEQYSNHDGYEHKYANLISDAGEEAIVYYLHHGKETEEFRHAEGHLCVSVPVDFSLKPGLQFSSILLKRIKKDFEEKKINIVHVMGYYPVIYDAIALFCRACSIPLVAQMHSGRNLSRIVRFPMLFFTLRLADKVLYVDPDEGRMLKFIFLKGELFPNWVEDDFFDMGLKREKDRFLFVGNVGNNERMRMKGFDVLLDFFRKYSKRRPLAKLVIVGKIMEEQKNAVKEKNVEFRGTISRKELAEEYNKASLTVLPSRFEPFSLAALESIACGTPSVITRHFGISKLIPGYALVLEDADSGKIIDLVESLSASKWERIKKKGIEFAEMFKKKKSSEKLISIYASILSRYGIG